MRRPDTPYKLGPVRPEWAGRAVATTSRLEFVFPAVSADNVGCAAVDSFPRLIGRRYYWQAAAWFPDSRYPDNHSGEAMRI
jgi:hypothetical protein